MLTVATIENIKKTPLKNIFLLTFFILFDIPRIIGAVEVLFSGLILAGLIAVEEGPVIALFPFVIIAEAVEIVDSAVPTLLFFLIKGFNPPLFDLLDSISASEEKTIFQENF